MWRGHNREPIFTHDVDRREYVDCLQRAYTMEVQAAIVLYAICLMLNHVHESGGPQPSMSIENAVKVFSNWMRNAHSWFGQGYNKRHNRQGKVAYDRPKTTEMLSDEDVLRVLLYIHANPVRAGIVGHPSNYRDSSHNFYAYGKKTPLTAHLSYPKAYLALGGTPEARQRRFRKMTDAYLRHEGLREDRPEDTVEALIGIASAEPLSQDHAGTPSDRARGDP